MSNEIKEFFNKQGSIGLILAIGPDGARYNEIEPQVAVSHDTLSNRIDDARKMGLIETEGVSKGSTSVINRLTAAGMVCYKGMTQDLKEAHSEYVEALEKYDKLSEKYTQQVGDEQTWLEWVLEKDVGRDSLMKRFQHRGEDAPYIVLSQFPESLKKALQQQSLDPLENIDDRDYWLWRFMKYPPEPEDDPDPEKYIQDSDSTTDN
jgi:DNA-binding HxlR family transcriptional regulator